MALTSAALAAPPDGVSAHGRMFGKGAPFDVPDLPASPLRKRLESLPAKARGRAMAWLHAFDFPGADTASLRVDAEGGVLYADAGAELPEAADPLDAEALATLQAAADDPFTLHSRPGSVNQVYLDFDGHTITGTAWNGTAGVDPLVARPFDLDGMPSSFSSAERAAIAEIWHRVAEDLSPFDIDVTTEDPISFGARTGRVLITAKTDANGKAMPYNTGGGVAYVGVFGWSNYASYYSPALVYFENLAKTASYIAEACSHEFGHNLGLAHDGTTSGVEYYAGHGSDYTSWAPIMGNSYYKNVTQWSRGEYSGANNTQDDLAIISSLLSYRADDHGNLPSSATALAVDSTGAVLVSNPETDPGNAYPQNKGVIGSRGDKDVFSFSAGAGPATIEVTPAWDAFYRTDKRGADLDLLVTLTDAAGNRIAESNVATDTYASLSASLSGGAYFVTVSATSSLNFSDYASLGQYFISGTVTPGSVPLNQPPVARFDAACSGLTCGFTSTAYDADGSIATHAWSFGDGASATGATASRTYAAAGTYLVGLTATDNAGAVASTSQSVAVTAPNTAPTAAFTVSCNNLDCAFTDASTDKEGALKSWQWEFGDGSTSTLQNPQHQYAEGGTYDVRLTVTDAAGASDDVVKAATATEPVAPGLTLKAVATKVKGVPKTALSWSGSAADGIDVYRNRAVVMTTPNDGREIDNVNKTGTYLYQVCDAGTSNCSPEVWVRLK